MKIQDKSVVSLHYELTGDDGAVIDSSLEQDPLVYLHGGHNIIPGLERALVGKTVGDQLKVTVQPVDGYGVMDPELVQTVPRSAFEGVDDIQPGMHFEAQGPNGRAQRITVESVSDEGVTVNGNHPLADKVLHFAVTIEAVRAATPEEIDHGHVH